MLTTEQSKKALLDAGHSEKEIEELKESLNTLAEVLVDDYLAKHKRDS